MTKRAKTRLRRQEANGIQTLGLGPLLWGMVNLILRRRSVMLSSKCGQGWTNGDVDHLIMAPILSFCVSDRFISLSALMLKLTKPTPLKFRLSSDGRTVFWARLILNRRVVCRMACASNHYSGPLLLVVISQQDISGGILPGTLSSLG